MGSVTSNCTNNVKSKDYKNKATPEIVEKRVGIWRLLMMPEPSFTFGLSALQSRWEQQQLTLSVMWRVLKEVYAINWVMFWCTALSHALGGFVPGLSLHCSNHLMFIIEMKVSRKDFVDADLYRAIAYRLALVVAAPILQWLEWRTNQEHKVLIKYHFEQRMLEASFQRDLPASQEKEAERNVSGEDASRAMSSIMNFGQTAISFLFQLQLVYATVMRGYANAGIVFIALNALSGLTRALGFFDGDFWRKSFVGYVVDQAYLRKKSLLKLTNNDYKEDVLTANLGSYLAREYAKAKETVGNVVDTWPEYGAYEEGLPFGDIIGQLIDALPTLYLSGLAIFWTNSLSMARLAALQTSSTSLRSAFFILSMTLDRLPSQITRVNSIYTFIDMKNQLGSGSSSYPPLGEKCKQGMSLDVRNVSFTYKGSKASRDAIKNVSLSIRAGQLVVIVGANGSGKSTLLRLLIRLYAPISGTIELDGRPVEEYSMDDLRRAIAHLSQDHKLFPLSVAENIGVGYLERPDDLELIKDAAVLAGADRVVEKFEKGYETVLEPASTAKMSFTASGNETLTAEFNKIEKSADVSGGERQRLVAARTFMRLFSDDVKFVTVDEPSSALDPQGEYDLFQRLRNARHGRTMIFVTHRFGHLTKHADLIICMKDGTIAERGTHDELLKADGEYAKLYNVQAAAFASESKISQ